MHLEGWCKEKSDFTEKKPSLNEYAWACECFSSHNFIFNVICATYRAASLVARHAGPGLFASSQSILNRETLFELQGWVRWARVTLGPRSLPCPTVDIGPAFARFIDRAVGRVSVPPFDPYANDVRLAPIHTVFSSLWTGI